jgi:hypothetical protein
VLTQPANRPDAERHTSRSRVPTTRERLRHRDVASLRFRTRPIRQTQRRSPKRFQRFGRGAWLELGLADAYLRTSQTLNAPCSNR